MSVREGSSCPGCGLANYDGMCPHCRGDQDAYERELVPPFESSLPFEDVRDAILDVHENPPPNDFKPTGVWFR